MIKLTLCERLRGEVEDWKRLKRDCDERNDYLNTLVNELRATVERLTAENARLDAGWEEANSRTLHLQMEAVGLQSELAMRRFWTPPSPPHTEDK